MDLDDLQKSWINMMQLAGLKDHQIDQTFDQNRCIRENINGWIMCISEVSDLQDAATINAVLRSISENKPLLISIEACEHPKDIISRIICRQKERGIIFWINQHGRIKTNLTKGNKQIEDPKKFMIKSFVESMHSSGRVSVDAIGSTIPVEQQHFWDDLSGRELNSELVKIARQEEMKEFAKHQVYEKVPIKECHDKTGQNPIGTRWVDINKGDDKHPEYRSRLVAQELNQYKRDDIFAATPPLEVLRLLISILASTRKQKRWKLDSIDIKRAYFHAMAKRDIYVRLPPEDHQSEMCGKLVKAMYGTRDAASNWEDAYTEFMISSGFKVGCVTPCLFWHPEKQLVIEVHGDDFTNIGSEEDLNWFKSQISSRFEFKHKARLGPDAGDDKSVRILNRIISWEDDVAINYEADQRHAEILVESMNLETANVVSTPGVKESGGEGPLSNQGTEYRAIAARSKYLAQDRPDIQFAIKEICRSMSKPDEEDWNKAKRFGRYIKGEPRLVQTFVFQKMPESIEAYADSDYAGCIKTRKSTSGGAIKFGAHSIKTWSSTQAVIALSSGEAEYYSLVKTASQAIGIRNMLSELGINVGINVHTDSSTAKRIALRRGAGKIRHIETNQLWLQDKVKDQVISIKKIGTNENSSRFIDQVFES